MSEIDDELFKRLVLINQYVILSHVDPMQRELWERSAERVRSHWPIDDLPQVRWMIQAASDPFTAEDRSFVADVLALYEALQRAENERIVYPTDPADFIGFDGDHETKYMAYARSMVDHEGRWTYLRRASRELDSQVPMRPSYERMLETWGSFGKPPSLAARQYYALVDAKG